jgi:hypothetical protein
MRCPVALPVARRLVLDACGWNASSLHHRSRSRGEGATPRERAETPDRAGQARFPRAAGRPGRRSPPAPVLMTGRSSNIRGIERPHPPTTRSAAPFRRTRPVRFRRPPQRSGIPGRRNQGGQVKARKEPVAAPPNCTVTRGAGGADAGPEFASALSSARQDNAAAAGRADAVAQLFSLLARCCGSAHAVEGPGASIAQSGSDDHRLRIAKDRGIGAARS